MARELKAGFGPVAHRLPPQGRSLLHQREQALSEAKLSCPQVGMAGGGGEGSLRVLTALVPGLTPSTQEVCS